MTSSARIDAATVTVPGTYPTIQQAVDGASSGSVIQLAPGRYNERVSLYSVGRNLTIRGDVNDPASYVIDGGGAGDVLRITQTGSNVSFEGLTVTGGAHGYNGYGGGLFLADSQAIFRNCVFTQNSADIDGGGAFLLRAGGLFERCTFQTNRAGRFGGGVIMNVGTTTVFDGCAFVDNEAGTSDPANGWGGGVHLNASSPTLRRCTIQGNRSRFAAGGIGATAFEGPTVVTLEDCTIADNVALQGNPTMPPPEGGGMHVENDALAVLRRCRVRGNSAGRGGGLNDYRARYDVSDTVIEDNTASLFAGTGGTGGGVYAQAATAGTPGPSASVIMTNSVVRGNAADVGGGLFVEGDFTGITNNQATLDLTGVLVVGNSAGSRAGGAFLDRTIATIRSSDFASNGISALTDSWGGGLAAVGSSVLDIGQTTFTGNVANQMGGGLFLEQGGQLQVADSRFWNNKAGTSPYGGNGIAVGQQPGPTPGPATGVVANTVLDDDGPGAEIWESNCDLSHYSAVLYRDDVIGNASGPVYYRNCTGATQTVAAFDALGATKGVGNVAGAASFATFLSAPLHVLVGTASTLLWCTPGSTNVTIDGGVGPTGSACGTVDVTPPVTTAYNVSSSSGPAGIATVEVICPGPGTPLPVSPVRGAALAAGTVTLTWAAGTGASSYDVYLDGNAQPTTLVASGIQGTTVDVPGIAADGHYSWQVVAYGGGCPTPTPSPVFSFDTCSGKLCEFVDHFDDTDLSAWKTTGPGNARVAGGWLYMETKRRLTVFPPAPALASGSIALRLLLARGRREGRVFFGYQDARNYVELDVRGTKGQIRLLEHVKRRTRLVGKAKHAMSADTAVDLEIDVAGSSVHVLVDGAEAITGTLSTSRTGTFGVQSVASTLGVDDLVIRAQD